MIKNLLGKKRIAKKRSESIDVQYSVNGMLFDELSFAERYRQTQIKNYGLDSDTKITKVESKTLTIVRQLRTVL
jgi:hypothetical protein|tara:strand:- start:651 stop:872 length:222 start_codon:yes stop_codon:yes gene_type:complete